MAAAVSPGQQAQSLFDALDANHDGVITREEFQAAGSAAGNPYASAASGYGTVYVQRPASFVSSQARMVSQSVPVTPASPSVRIVQAPQVSSPSVQQASPQQVQIIDRIIERPVTIHRPVTYYQDIPNVRVLPERRVQYPPALDGGQMEFFRGQPGIDGHPGFQNIPKSFPYHDPAFGAHFRRHRPSEDVRDHVFQETEPDEAPPLQGLMEYHRYEQLAAHQRRRFDHGYCEMHAPLPLRHNFEMNQPATVCVDPNPAPDQGLAWLLAV